MEEDFSSGEASLQGQKQSLVHPSRDKTSRIMLLAILFQVSWPVRLTKESIRQQIHWLYGDHPQESAVSRYCHADKLGCGGVA